ANLGLCGVGLLQLDQGNWHLVNEKYLRLQIEGAHLAVDRFAYETIYQIVQLDERSLRLRVVERLKSEVKDFH
ncbi:MAG: hypothetical protein AAGD05_03515, partial [Bacteroidota bacterium]